MKALPKSTRASVLGYAALTLILTAGAAQSLSGSNTVFSDDIVDGQVATPDLKTGAVSGSKILDNSVTGTDVNEATLKPRILTTAVSSAGVKLLGSGTAAFLGTGTYTVDYGFPVAGCTAQATPGASLATNFGSFPFPTTLALASTAEHGATKVSVYIRDSGNAAMHAFFVTLICP